MHIVKSLHAGVLYRSFTVQRRHLFSATALWAFALDSGRPVLEKDFWGMVAGALEGGQVLDAGMPKACGEFLVAGRFFAPGGHAVEAGRVAVRVGHLSKTLAIHGDRYWKPFLRGERGIAGPKPFTEMPLTWSHAFGGAGFAENPEGKGVAPVLSEGVEIHPLPNIEYPDAMVTSLASRPRPAGLGPIPVEWPQRTRYAGTYDEHYLKTQMPGLADDVDWHLFNAAAPDQWQENGQFWHGNEPYELQFMHPELACLRGHMPGIHGRLFIRRKINGTTVFEEILTRLDTLWLLPACNLGLVLHRGCVECSSEDAHDIQALMVAHENMHDAPRTREHYETQLQLRTDPAESFKYLLNTGPLIPEGCVCGFEEMKAASAFPLEMLVKQNADEFAQHTRAEAEAKKQEQLEALRAKLTESGIDAEQILAQLEKARAEPNADAIEITRLTNAISPGLAEGKPVDFTRLDLKAIDALNAYVDALAKQKRAEAMDHVAEQIAKLKQETTDPEVLAGVAKLERQLEELKRPPPLPRPEPEALTKIAEEQLEGFDSEIKDLESQGLSAEHVAKLKADLAAMRERAEEIKHDIKKGYRQGAHLIAEARSPHEGQEPALRQKVTEAIAALAHAHTGTTSTAFVDADLAFVDLSGLDLRGLDFSGAYLEYVNFSQADIRGVNFTGAILAHAHFKEANAEGANFKDANLGATHLENSIFDACSFEGATFGKAHIVRSRFKGARFLPSPATFLESTFDHADFSEACMPQQTFLERDLRGCMFKGTDLTESFFVKSSLDGCDFSGSTLTSVNFVELSANEACFNEAKMHNVRFVAGCQVKRARFEHALITAANLRDVNAEGANFRRSILDGADFSGIQLQQATLEKCSAIQTQFNQADLTGTRCNGANGYGAGFMQARLIGTLFDDSNLYSANFLSATLGNTSFARANLDQTLLQDWRPS